MWNHLSTHHTSIEEVYAGLEQKSKEFDRPWSVAELKLSEADVDWLGLWFAALPREATLTSANLLGHGLPRDKFAALLIVLGAERCRRTASEDYVWPVVRKLLPSDHPLTAELFLSNGQPSYLCRLAIDEAAHGLNLRNAMDIEGTQQWFMTIKLQFGFTYRGAKRRLAEWLVGLGAPLSVQYLSGLVGTTELMSTTFLNTWRTLRQYRREVISEEDARDALAKSPWVKEDWLSDLLVEARTHVAADRGDWDPEVSRSDSMASTPEERGPLERIALSWPTGGSPRITFRLDREAVAEQCRSAQCSELDFYVDGQYTRRWVLQSDGSWDGPESIPAEPGTNPERPNLAPKTLSVRSGNGDVIQQWDLADFGLKGDAFVFDLDEGLLLEFGEDQLNPSGHYAMLCDRAYSLDGNVAPETYDRPGSARKAIRLPTPLLGNLRLIYEDFTIWQPVGPQDANRARVAATLQTVHDQEVSIGERTRLAVRGLPDDAGDVVMLVGRRVKSTSPLDGAWVTSDEIAVSPELAVGSKAVRVRYIHEGRCVTVMPKRCLRLKGAATILLDRRHPEAEPKLAPLGPEDVLQTAADAAQVRVWVPDDATAPRAFEGDYYVGPLRHGRVMLKDFPGLGGLLSVKGNEHHAFGNVCINSGWVRSMFVGLGRPAQIGLDVKREPEPRNHSFIAWLPHGDGRAELAILPPDTLLTRQKSQDWQVDAPENMLAFALTYQGNWKGAWWSERLVQLKFQPSTSFFAAVRWLRLPVLNPELGAWLEPVVDEKPFAFLEAWLQNKGLPVGVHKPDYEPAFDTVVRQFIGHWRPREDARCFQAVQMVSGAEPRTREALLGSVGIVGRYSLPLLWWVASKLAHEGGPLLREAIASLLGLQGEESERQASGRFAGLQRSTLEHCAFSEAGLDELASTVLRWLEHPAATLPMSFRKNLLVALGSEAGRRYFAVKILQRIAPNQGRT